MKKQTWSVIKYLLLLLVGVLFLVLAFKGQNLAEMAQVIKSANFYWIFLSIFLSILAGLSRAQRWNMLIRPLGHRPSLGNAFAALMAGYLANLAIPRMGEVSRCAALAQAEKVPFNSLIGTVITERVLDLIMLALCIIIAVLLSFKTVGGIIVNQFLVPLASSSYSIITSWEFYAISTLLIVGIIFIFRNKKRNDTPLLKKIIDFLIGIGKGMKSVFIMENKGWFLFHTLFIWIMYFLMSYVCFFAIKETSEMGLMAGLIVLIAGSLGMTAPVQGGIGVYHYLVAMGLTLFAVPLGAGYSYAVIIHTSQVLVVLLTGGISILYFSLKKNKVNDQI